MQCITENQGVNFGAQTSDLYVKLNTLDVLLPWHNTLSGDLGA